MEKLDSVNVFIFSVLKFKKWNPSLAPGCALSCLKRSDYLLKVFKEGLEGLAHQLITKQQRCSFFSFFLVGKKKKIKMALAGFVTNSSSNIVVLVRASDLCYFWIQLCR